MKCEYCGTEILSGNEVMSDGHTFCSSLHRKWWNERGVAGASTPAVRPSPAAAKSGTRAKLIGLVTTALFVAIRSYIGSRAAGGWFGSGNSLDASLMHAASEINKSCPMMVDRETRLDNTVAGSGKTLIYNYTLVNFTRAQIDTTVFESSLKPRMINAVKTNTGMKYFRDNNVTLDYRYSDKDGVFVMDIKITPEEYR